MCVCMCVYMCVKCVHVYMRYVILYISVYIYGCVSVCSCMYACVNVTCVCSLCISKCVHVCICRCMHICVPIYMCVCVRICVCMCVTLPLHSYLLMDTQLVLISYLLCNKHGNAYVFLKQVFHFLWIFIPQWESWITSNSIFSL